MMVIVPPEREIARDASIARWRWTALVACLVAPWGYVSSDAGATGGADGESLGGSDPGQGGASSGGSEHGREPVDARGVDGDGAGLRGRKGRRERGDGAAPLGHAAHRAVHDARPGRLGNEAGRLGCEPGRFGSEADGFGCEPGRGPWSGSTRASPAGDVAHAGARLDHDAGRAARGHRARASAGEAARDERDAPRDGAGGAPEGGGRLTTGNLCRRDWVRTNDPYRVKPRRAVPGRDGA